MHSARVLVVVGWLALAFAGSVMAAQPALAPLAQCVPSDAVLALELSDAKPVLDLLLDAKTVGAVTSLPIYGRVVSTPNFRQFRAGVAFLESSLQTTWPEALRVLLGGGATLSVHPGGGVLLVADSQDPVLLGQLQGLLVAIAKAQAEQRGQPGQVVSTEYQGAKVWMFAPNSVHTIVGGRLLWANRPELLKSALDLRTKAPAGSLASLEAYRLAKQGAGPAAQAVALVDMAVLKHLPQVHTALEPSKNPMVSLLFAGIAEAVREANWLVLGLQMDGDTIGLRIAADSKVPGAQSTAGFALPRSPGEGCLPHLAVPGKIASVSLYRDLHAFYAAKDAMFPERTSELIFFENMMGIFFTGRDLTDEVMAETTPHIRVVVAEQQYDPAVGTPRVQVPAFAAVFRLKNAKQFGEVAEEAWQKALGLVNFVRGQQALPGLILDRPMHGDVQFTVARFAAPKDADKTSLDTRFNFRPALVMLGDFMVLSSTEALARDLIDALKQEIASGSKPMAAAHTLLELDGAKLTSILAANRDHLISQNMLEKGHMRDQAEGEVDTLLSIAGLLGELKLSIASPNGRTDARTTLSLRRPTP